MPTRQEESTHESKPNHPVPEGVESPSADSPTQPEAATAQPRRSSRDEERAEAGQMQGANSLPRQSSPERATADDTNADDTEPGAGDQDIDTAGTEADELSATHAAFGLSGSRAKGS